MEKRWKQKIILIWLGQSLSLLTSSVMQMAIIWYITLETGSAVMLTFATIAGFMPQALLGAFTGPFIDRHAKKKVLMGSDSFVALASLVLAAFAFFDNLPIWLILLILALRSLGTAFHEPASQAITPLFVPRDYLAEYAGYSQAFDSLCMLLSPAIAIVLYVVMDLWVMMVLDVFGALFAVTILFFVPFPKEILAKKSEKGESLWKETKEGIKVLRGEEGILALIVLGMLYSVIYCPVGSLYPHITINYFGGTTAQSGLVEVLFSVGSLVGAFLLAKVARKLPKLWGMIASIVLYGTGVLIIGFLKPDGFVIFAVLSLIMGLSIPFYHGIHRAIFQMTLPQEFLGRAFAISQSSKRLGMPVGLLLGGFFADGAGINMMFRVAGLLALCLALWVGKWPGFQRFRRLS